MSTLLAEKAVDEFDPKHLRRKRGAPKANGNAIRHGLTAGKLPRGAAYIARISGVFRTSLEAAVIDHKTQISLHDAAVIQTAVRWERHSQLAQRWLRKEFDRLTPDQKLHYSREVARASAERDRCLRLLGLGESKVSDPWAQFDAWRDDSGEDEQTTPDE